MENVTWKPRKWFEGTRSLTFEQRGVYFELTNQMYLIGGAIYDDDAFNAALCGLPIRRFRKVKDDLISAGKLHRFGEKNDRLVSNRVQNEVKSYEDYLSGQSERGKKGGKASAKSRKNNDVGEAPGLSKPQADAQALPSPSPSPLKKESPSSAREAEPVDNSTDGKGFEDEGLGGGYGGEGNGAVPVGEVVDAAVSSTKVNGAKTAIADNPEYKRQKRIVGFLAKRRGMTEIEATQLYWRAITPDMEGHAEAERAVSEVAAALKIEWKRPEVR